MYLSATHNNDKNIEPTGKGYTLKKVFKNQEFIKKLKNAFEISNKQSTPSSKKRMLRK